MFSCNHYAQPVNQSYMIQNSNFCATGFSNDGTMERWNERKKKAPSPNKQTNILRCQQWFLDLQRRFWLPGPGIPWMIYFHQHQVKNVN